MARTAKKKLAIYDEGVLLVDDIDILDFAGAGVAGTITGSSPSKVTETISGGGASVTSVVGEVVSFTGTGGTLAHTPTVGSVELFRGGIRQQNLAVTGDYTISGATITLITAASTGEVFLANYTY